MNREMNKACAGDAFAARQPDDVMASVVQFIRDSFTDEARRAGYEYSHGSSCLVANGGSFFQYFIPLKLGYYTGISATRIVWHERVYDDPGYVWLHGTIADAVRVNA